MPQPFNLQDFIDHGGNWDWANKHVSQAYYTPEGGIDANDGIAINDIVESGTVLVAAGPADLEKANDTVTANASENSFNGIRIVPIGLVETATIAMNKPLSRIFEIGSQLSYIIPGRTVGGISLSRVFFDGPSLLKIIYAGEVEADFATLKNKYAKFISNKFVDGANTNQYQKFANIGSGNMAANLASSFFDQPIGLAFYFKDQQNDTVSQLYFEGCRVSTWNLGISANMNVLTEAINMEFIRCRPILTAATKDYVKGTTIADINIVSGKDEGIGSTIINEQ